MGNINVVGYFEHAASHIQILSAALTGIEEYEGSLPPFKELLENLHGKIGKCLDPKPTHRTTLKCLM